MFRSLTFKLSAVLLAILTVAAGAQAFQLAVDFGRGWAVRQAEIAGALLERVSASGGGNRIDLGAMPAAVEDQRLGPIALRLYGPSAELLDQIGNLQGQPPIGVEALDKLRQAGPERVRRLIPFTEGLALGLKL